MRIALSEDRFGAMLVLVLRIALAENRFTLFGAMLVLVLRIVVTENRFGAMLVRLRKSYRVT